MVWFEDSFGRLFNSDFIIMIDTDRINVTAHFDNPDHDETLFEGGEIGDADGYIEELKELLEVKSL